MFTREFQCFECRQILGLEQNMIPPKLPSALRAVFSQRMSKRKLKYQFDSSTSTKAIDFSILNSKKYLLYEDSLKIGSMKFQLENDISPNRIQKHADDGLFTIGGDSLQVYDPHVELVFEFPVKCSNHALKDTMVACCMDNQVRLCDLRSGSSIQSIKCLPKVLDFSDQREYLLLIGGPETQLFDLRMYRKVIDYHATNVNCCLFGNDFVIACQKGSRGYAVDKIFDLYDSRLIKQEQGHLNNKRDWIDCLLLDDVLYHPSDCGAIYEYRGKSNQKLLGHLSDCFGVQETNIDLASISRSSVIDWKAVL